MVVTDKSPYPTDAFANDGGTEMMIWQPLHAVLAVSLALVLYSLDAIEVVFYDHARAPNVGLVVQLTLLLLFYILWAVVPRFIWAVTRNHFIRVGNGVKPMIWRLAVLGLIAYALHMTVLAIVLRIMHSPPGWGPYHILLSVIELWIQQAGIWWSIFAGVSIFIFFLQQRFLREANKQDELIYQVRHGNKLVPVNINHVYWIEAADNYVLLHTQKSDYLYRKSLTALEEEARSFGMVRAHRSALVNKAFIQAVSRDKTKGDYRVELADGMTVPLSRRRLSVFREHMGIA